MKIKTIFILIVSILLATIPFCYAKKRQTLTNTSVGKLKKTEPDLWYVDLKPPKLKTTLDSTKKKADKLNTIDDRQPPDFLFDLISFFKWLFIIFLVFGIMYVIIKGNFKFNFKRKSNEKVSEIITESTKIENEEQLQKIGFEHQITDAENNQNYRLATRLYYLWVIKLLVDQKQIKFHIDKTNLDYCNEMTSQPHYQEFLNCTNYYNYVWFGEFKIDRSSYEKITEKFKTLINSIA